MSQPNNEGRMVGLAHIGVMTADINKSIEFYRDVLGLELTYQAELNGTKLAFLNIGSCIIELVAPPDVDSVTRRDNGRVDHVAIEVQNIEQLVDKLKAKGVKFFTEDIAFVPNLFEGTKCIFFPGPSGERIELFQYRKLDA